MTKLLVSVRGPNEAVNAAKGGAQILDVEFPKSALGTVYPLNIYAVRRALDDRGFTRRLVSTNIGERQTVRSTACQAALGVATAGASLVKCGFAKFDYERAEYLGRNIVNTVKRWYPKAKVIPSLFIDLDLAKILDPIRESIHLAQQIKAHGILIDTFNKQKGMGLLDYVTLTEIKRWARHLHAIDKQAWIAGSITEEELKKLADTGVDVICVRAAACEQIGRQGRMGQVTFEKVKGLIKALS